MANKILHVYKDVDFRMQHPGLKALMGNKNLKPGEHVIFLNRKMNRIKVMSKGDVLTYKVSERGRLDMDMIRHIPETFGAGDFTMREALKKAILLKLAKKGRK